MVARARLLQARVLPHGWLDALRQVSLFGLAYVAYRIVRGVVEGDANAAFAHARDLISLERTLHVFVEPSIQTWASGSHGVMVAASWLYVNAQTSITIGALLYLYLRRNGNFYFVRNMLLIAMPLALIGYMAFPTAPPRFLPEWGFIDTVAQFTGVPQDSVTVDALFNPYAAVPSMHAGFALMIGWPLARLVKPRWLKVFWATYPLIVTFVIVATANHFLADAFLGACTAGIGALAARWLARVRPADWSFRSGAKQAATA